jgi:uncharacterized membrane protein YgaE (UPF0421/DUF939 family)
MENKTGKYFKYAFGEIFLVMIGILLALQVNNWNQNQGIKKQLKNYRTSLLSEIEKDLKELERIDSLNLSHTNEINEYFALYNSKNMDLDALLSKQRNINATCQNFQSNIYSIDELITSGSISFFNQKEKLAIVTLKKQIELYTYYEKEAALTRKNRREKYADLVDMAFRAGLTKTQNEHSKKLSSDINSEYFRHFNNALTAVLKYYEYQDYIYSLRIRPELINLKNILLENIE